MKQQLKFIPFLLFCLIGSISFAQNGLSLEDALKIGLKNNYDIQLLISDKEIADLNNSAGSAGMLPRISANFSHTTQDNNIYQKLASGQETNRKGAISNNSNGFVGLNYTFFDGGKMFILRDKLALLEKQADFNLQIALLNLKYAIIQQYFLIINNELNIESFQKTLIYAQSREELSNLRLSTGVSAKTDFLQAQIDLNNIKIQLENFKTLKENNLIGLKNLLNIPRDTQITLTTKDYPIDVSKLIQLEKIENNPILSYYKNDILIADKIIKEYKTDYLPALSTQLGYSYNRTQAQAGFLLLNQQTGPTAQFGVNIPIYNGGLNKQNIRISEVQKNKAEINLKKSERELNDALSENLSLLIFYQSQFDVLVKNTQLAQENLDLVSLRFKQGISTSLEIREAEKNYQDAIQRQNDTKLNLIKSATEIQKAIGE